MGIVSAELGAVRVGEFGKERKGKIKRMKDGLTTTCDSERVEEKSDEVEIKGVRQPHDPGRGTARGRGWSSKGECVKSRKERKEGSTRTKRMGITGH
jgi:hypothetical protein